MSAQEVNQNRIVRVFNDKIHKMLNYIAKLTQSSYQQAFDEFLLYIQEGHILGEESTRVLIERVLKKRAGL